MASSHLLHSPLPKSITFVYIPHPPSTLRECELEPGKLWPRVWAFRCEGQRKKQEADYPLSPEESPILFSNDEHQKWERWRCGNSKRKKGLNS